MRNGAEDAILRPVALSKPRFSAAPCKRHIRACMRLPIHTARSVTPPRPLAAPLRKRSGGYSPPPRCVSLLELPPRDFESAAARSNYQRPRRRVSWGRSNFFGGELAPRRRNCFIADSPSAPFGRRRICVGVAVAGELAPPPPVIPVLRAAALSAPRSARRRPGRCCTRSRRSLR